MTFAAFLNASFTQDPWPMLSASMILLADLLPEGVIRRRGRSRFEPEEKATMERRSLEDREDITARIALFKDCSFNGVIWPPTSSTDTRSTDGRRDPGGAGGALNLRRTAYVS
uniref:Uncharacterized protein n=1 Tax=Opuntia streptacantha TaxID=393608 RepID=A0A7C9EPB9_OPUST